MPEFMKIERVFDTDQNPFCETYYWWDRDSEEFVFGFNDYFYYHEIGTDTEIIGQVLIKIFPNPANDLLNITGLDQPAEMRLFSVTGHLLKTENGITDKIVLSDLPPGLYLLELTQNHHLILRERVVKVNCGK